MWQLSTLLEAPIMAQELVDEFLFNASSYWGIFSYVWFISHFCFEFVDECFGLVGDAILYLDKAVVIHTTWPLLLNFDQVFFWSSHQAVLFVHHRLVIWMILLLRIETSISDFSTGCRVRRALLIIQRTRPCIHASSRSKPFLFNIGYADYLVTLTCCILILLFIL